MSPHHLWLLCSWYARQSNLSSVVDLGKMIHREGVFAGRGNLKEGLNFSVALRCSLTLLFTQAYSYVTLSFTCAMHPDDNDSEVILFSPTLHRSPGSRRGHSPIQPVIFRLCGGSCISMQRKRWSQGADGQTGRIARLCADPNARSISFPFHVPHT